MSKPRLSFFLLLFLLVLQACGPDANEGQLQAQPTANAQPFSDSALPAPPPLITPVPRMEAGSLYRYFDGALLDAVPNDGPFLMGDGLQSDSPQHQVTVSDYWIYNVEVTNQMYAWCVKVGKCSPPDLRDNRQLEDPQYGSYPVVGVNWQQAADYCSFAHGRLPTEAEWEKAASWDAAVKAKRLYPWGDKRASCTYVNAGRCLGRAAPSLGFAAGRSYYGVFNTAGNVFEWTSDWYSPAYYESSPVQDPRGPDAGVRRSIRSSGFSSDAYMANPARRSSAQPTDHRNDLGFRCVVQDPVFYAPFCTVPVFHGLALPASLGGLSSYNKPCPDPVIQHYDGCSVTRDPVNFVRIRNSAPTLVTVSGLQDCTPAGNDIGSTHQCQPGITITVNASCDAQPAGSPACPPNYLQDPANPARCTAIGRPGSCPAGYQFDSQSQCCTAAAEANIPAPLCSVGEHLYNGICVDDATGPWPPLSQTYTVNTGLNCSVRGDGR